MRVGHGGGVRRIHPVHRHDSREELTGEHVAHPVPKPLHDGGRKRCLILGLPLASAAAVHAQQQKGDADADSDVFPVHPYHFDSVAPAASGGRLQVEAPTGICAVGIAFVRSDDAGALSHADLCHVLDHALHHRRRFGIPGVGPLQYVSRGLHVPDPRLGMLLPDVDNLGQAPLIPARDKHIPQPRLAFRAGRSGSQGQVERLGQRDVGQRPGLRVALDEGDDFACLVVLCPAISGVLRPELDLVDAPESIIMCGRLGIVAAVATLPDDFGDSISPRKRR